MKGLSLAVKADFGQLYSKETLQEFRDYSNSSYVNLRTIGNCILLVVVPYVLLMPVVALKLDDIDAGYQETTGIK